MGENDAHAGCIDTSVQCIEVLVFPSLNVDSGNNLRWTLSIYALENQPLPNDAAHGEKFHFMLYDWDRTIKHLLAENKISYSVTRSFMKENIFDAPQEFDYSQETAGIL